MPTPRTVKKHGGIVSVKKKRLPNGTKLWLYIYNDGKQAVTKKEKHRGT